MPRRDSKTVKRLQRMAAVRAAKLATKKGESKGPNAIEKRKSRLIFKSPRVLGTKATGSTMKRTSPSVAFVSPQKTNAPRAKGDPLMDTGTKIMLTLNCLQECVCGVLQVETRDITIDDMEKCLAVEHRPGMVNKAVRPSKLPSRFVDSSEEEPTHEEIKSKRQKLTFKHHRGLDASTHLRAINAFFVGQNHAQCDHFCKLNNDRAVSKNVHLDLMGKRMHRHLRGLWLITQRLSMDTASSLHLHAGLWDGVEPLGITVACDARWQKCRGWNSLHSTSCAVDFLSGSPMHATCLHRARPTEVSDDTPEDPHDSSNIVWKKKLTEKSAKGCDAEGARLLVKDMMHMHVDVLRMMKDGDSSSMEQARQMKDSLLAELPLVERNKCNPGMMELLCARHHAKNCVKSLSEKWKKQWDAPKGTTCAYTRGTIGKMIKANKGDRDRINSSVRSLTKHISGDHSSCDPALPCVKDANHEQTLTMTDEEALKAMDSVLDDHYNEDKLEKLKHDVTTNSVESLNFDMMVLFPKRLCSRAGARCDNYSHLVVLRRIYGRGIDGLILRLMGFQTSASMLKEFERIDNAQASSRIAKQANKKRRREIRKIRSGWDKKRTKEDKKAGFTCKNSKKKGTSKGSKPARKRRKRNVECGKKTRGSKNAGRGRPQSENDENGSSADEIAAANSEEMNVESDSSDSDLEIADDAGLKFVQNRGQLLSLIAAQEKFMAELSRSNAKSDRAARNARRAARR